MVKGMVRALTGLAVLAVLLAAVGAGFRERMHRPQAEPPPASPISEGEPAPEETAPGLRALLRAYPDALLDAAGNELVWKDGTVTVYDDGIPDKTLGELLDSPDLEDQMSMAYPRGEIKAPAAGWIRAGCATSRSS
ncbi:MAG: hypothetical protein ACOC8N_01535 [Spirochaetota bacterium]